MASPNLPPERFGSFHAENIKGGFRMVCKLLPEHKEIRPDNTEAKIVDNKLIISATVKGNTYEGEWDARKQPEILEAKKEKGKVSVDIMGTPSDEIAQLIVPK